MVCLWTTQWFQTLFCPSSFFIGGCVEIGLPLPGLDLQIIRASLGFLRFIQFNVLAHWLVLQLGHPTTAWITQFHWVTCILNHSSERLRKMMNSSLINHEWIFDGASHIWKRTPWHTPIVGMDWKVQGLWHLPCAKCRLLFPEWIQTWSCFSSQLSWES